MGISLSIAIIPWVFPIYSNYWILLDRNGKHSLPGSGVHVFIGPLGSCCLGGTTLSIVHHDLWLCPLGDSSLSIFLCGCI